MKRSALALALAVALPVALLAQGQPAKPTASVAGKWTMTMETPHGKMTAGFDLKVDGKKVTGTFVTDHTDKAALTGEFAEGKLTFRTMEGGVTFTATLKDADTLNGVLSSERGDLQGIATRVKK